MLNPLNAKLNPICHLLALLGAHPILHISRIRVKPFHLIFLLKLKEKPTEGRRLLKIFLLNDTF